jgi:hypothetical protein
MQTSSALVGTPDDQLPAIDQRPPEALVQEFVQIGLAAADGIPTPAPLAIPATIAATRKARPRTLVKPRGRMRMFPCSPRQPPAGANGIINGGFRCG